MIDVAKAGDMHIQLWRAAGLSVFSWFLTRNEAHELHEKLGKLLEPERQIEPLIPDD